MILAPTPAKAHWSTHTKDPSLSSSPIYLRYATLLFLLIRSTPYLAIPTLSLVFVLLFLFSSLSPPSYLLANSWIFPSLSSSRCHILCVIYTYVLIYPLYSGFFADMDVTFTHIYIHMHRYLSCGFRTKLAMREPLVQLHCPPFSWYMLVTYDACQ